MNEHTHITVKLMYIAETIRERVAFLSSQSAIGQGGEHGKMIEVEEISGRMHDDVPLAV